MAVTFQDKVELIGKYKDKEGFDSLQKAYKFGKNIDSPKLNDAQRNQIRGEVDKLYTELSALIKKEKARESKSTTGAKKKTILGLASEIKKKENITWDKAKAKARMEFQSEKKKAIRAEKTELADFKKTIGKINWLRATTYKKKDKIVSTDIKKDEVIPALPSGKRYPKRGKTTNQYGTFDNSTKKPYWENRANRMDVNQPSKQVKIKLAKGGSMNDNLYFDQLAGMSGARAVAIKEWASANNLSKDDLLNIIQGLGRKQITSADFVSAVLGDKSATSEIVSYAKSGKAFKMAKGGEVDEIAQYQERLEIGKYLMKQLEEEGKNSSNSSEYRDFERLQNQYKNRIARLNQSLNPIFPQIKTENLSVEDLKKKYNSALFKVNELRLGNIKPSNVIKQGRVTKERADQMLMDMANQYKAELEKRGITEYAKGGNTAEGKICWLQFYGEFSESLIDKIYDALEEEGIQVDVRKKWHTKGYAEEFMDENGVDVRFLVSDAKNPTRLMKKILYYSKRNMNTFDFTILEKKEKGGEIAKGNYEMMLSQAKEVQHHAKELQNILKGEKDIEAWVVAKMENVSSTLSDITHYLDGKTEYAKGGTTKRIKRMGC